MDRNFRCSLCGQTKSPQLCLTLCDPMDCSPPGFSVHGILQARTLPGKNSSRRSSRPRDQTAFNTPALPGGFFTASTTWEPYLQIRDIRASLAAQMVKNLPAMQETQIQSLGQENPLEMGMATHSSILAWRIPWTEEPGIHGVTNSQI